MKTTPAQAPLLGFLAGGGEMSELCRSTQWDASRLGPVESWPQALRSSLSICLNTRFPIAIYWGADAVLLYNDAWRPIVGEKHPWSFGRPGAEVWSEIWDVVGPVFGSVMSTGEGSFQRDALLFMRRFGYTEECYFDYTFSPIWGESGRVEGVFNAVTETTERVLSDRRSRLLGELSRSTASAQSPAEACRLAASVLQRGAADVPFALVYLADGESGAATLVASSPPGLAPGIAPARVEAGEEAGPWPLSRVLGGESFTLQHLEGLAMTGGPWPEPAHSAVVLPLRTGQERPAGAVVLGVSPRRALDERYRSFLELVASGVAMAVSHARAFEAERARAESFAELNRAKTAFFSNVSHEFRTPLTLMLGPLQDVLSRWHGELPQGAAADIKLAQRSAVRLQKLVNTLLEFSRIEAGRVHAKYEPTDLAAYTAELASTFRSAVEKAGLRLVVECPPLSHLVEVDREMWEKIVLNLLSNAFKYTLQGEIRVALHERDGAAVLSVADTGVGIPREAMPRLFERFFRAEGVHGRTHEGTGIGLALVQDLVKLHRGSVTAESELGRGSTLTVTVPLGSEHLVKDRIVAARSAIPAPAVAEEFAQEALSWIGEGSSSPVDDGLPAHNSAPGAGPVQAPLVLLADDNHDMRRYIARLLSTRYRVVAVRDGEEALDAIGREHPDLVVTDVMMPRLDGFGLLRALRADPRTASIPVVMLSARAGEESRLEGLDRGADDYLVKPFSARELVARIDAQVKLSTMRREAWRTVRESDERLRLAATAGGFGVHDYDIASGRLVWSDELYDIAGIARGTPVTPATVESTMHPEDRERIVAKMLAAMDPSGQGAFDEVFRVVRLDTGEMRWVHNRCRTRFSAEEPRVAVRNTGVVIDVTDRVRSQLHAAILADVTNAMSRLASTDEIIQEVGKRLASHFGLVSFQFDEVDEKSGLVTVPKAWRRPGERPLTGPFRQQDYVTPAFLERARAGQTIVIRDTRDDPLTDRDAHDAIGIRSYVLVPLFQEGRWRSSMAAASDQARAWQDDEVELLEEIARRLFPRIERAQAEEALRASEERYRAVVENLTELVCRFRPDGTVLFANEAYAKAAGLSVEEVERRNFWERVAEADRAAVRAMLDGLTPASPEARIENRFMTPDGERWTFWTNRGLKFDGDGRLLEAQSTGIDITDRKRAEAALRASEQALRRSEETLRIAKEAAALGVHDYDVVSGDIRWDARARELWGVGPDEPVTYDTFLAGIHPDDRAATQAAVDRVMHPGGDGRFYAEYRVRSRRDGSVRHVAATGKATFEHGRAIRLVGTVQDITARKQFEGRQAFLLKLSDALRPLASPAEVKTVAAHTLGEQLQVHRVLYAEVEGNDWLVVPGYERDVVALPEGKYSADTYGHWIMQIFRDGKPLIYSDARTDPRFTPAEREAHVALDVVSSVGVPLVKEGRLVAILVVHMAEPREWTEEDIALVEGTAERTWAAVERARAESIVRESEERFRGFTDTAPAMLWVTDADGMCTFLSRGWYEYTGQTQADALGIGWTNAVHPEDRDRVGREFLAAHAAHSPHFSLEYRLRRADGQYRWALDFGRARFATYGQFLGYVGNVVDIDEQKRASEELARHRERLEAMVAERTAELEASHRQLRLSERMAALGTLSAGLGHDMGNLLLPIRFRLESLSQAQLPGELQQDVEVIRTATEYLGKLSSGLRQLAADPSGHAGEREPIDVRAWWDEAEPVLRNALRRGMTLRSRFPAAACWVRIGRPALTQVIFNLVQNASEAMRERDSGTVTVWAEWVDDAIRLGVSDDGPGMTAEVKARCMEPYFTTKTRGISTGMGLALVYGIMQSVGGSVAVESDLGTGTTFILTLPVAHASPVMRDTLRNAVALNEARLERRD